jgi:hypothetical protein
MVKGDRQIGAARVPHRWSGRVAVAVSVGVAGSVPLGKSRGRSGADTRLLSLARSGSLNRWFGTDRRCRCCVEADATDRCLRACPTRQ